jgi:RNA polymerase sigma factor
VYKILLLERIKIIKEGNLQERDLLIQEYIPFILKTISNILNKYIETENSEEFMIGLEAFNESIDKYEDSRGSFITFSSVVIKNKIIDYIRKEKSNNKIMYIDEYDDSQCNRINSQNEINKFNEGLSMQMELMDLKNKLSEFKITLDDLVKDSPKHEDTRNNAIRVARFIQENINLKEKLYLDRKLPYTQIISEYKSTRKFLDRNKKFIVATVLILDSNLDSLKSYIYDAERRASFDI